MKSNKAQSFAEYSILAVLVLTAITGIQLYVKRGLQAKYKNVVDCAGDMSGTKQYEPYYVQSEEVIKQDFVTEHTYEPKGVVKRTIDEEMLREDAVTTDIFDLEADDDWL